MFTCLDGPRWKGDLKWREIISVDSYMRLRSPNAATPVCHKRYTYKDTDDNLNAYGNHSQGMGSSL